MSETKITPVKIWEYLLDGIHKTALYKRTKNLSAWIREAIREKLERDK